MSFSKKKEIKQLSITDCFQNPIKKTCLSPSNKAIESNDKKVDFQTFRVKEDKTKLFEPLLYDSMNSTLDGIDLESLDYFNKADSNNNGFEYPLKVFVCDGFKNLRQFTVSKYDIKENSLFILLEDVVDKCIYNCHIDLSYLPILVNNSDLINIIGDPDENRDYKIDINSDFLLILKPNKMLTVTQIIQSIDCVRMANFNLKLQQSSLKNNGKALLIGNMVHKMFNLYVESSKNGNLIDADDLRHFLVKSLNNMEWFISLYENQVDPDYLIDESMKYIQSIVNWNKKVKDGSLDNIKLSLTEVEQNVALKLFGIKGQIDAVYSSENGLHFPIELKTGKISGSAGSNQHRAQLSMYNNMSTIFNQETTTHGYLFYAQSNSTIKLNSSWNEFRHLINLRNQIVSREYFGDDSLSGLPDMMNCCKYCFHSDVCSLNFVADGDTQSIESLKQLWTSTKSNKASTIMDNPKEIAYFKKWRNLLDKEYQVIKSNKITKTLVEEFKNIELEDKMCKVKILEQFIKDDQQFVNFILSSNKTPYLTDNFHLDVLINIIPNEIRIGAIATGVINSITKDQMIVKISKPINNRWLNHHFILKVATSDKILLAGYSYLSNFMIDNNPRVVRLKNIICGLDHPLINSNQSTIDNSITKSITDKYVLNDDQIEAINKSIADDDFTIISGPPGTGKTQTIVCLIQTLISLKKSVLLVANTNNAIDNILDRLHDHDIYYLKIGKSKNATSLNELNNFENIFKANYKNHEQFRTFLNRIPVVASTFHRLYDPIITGRLRHENLFDVCIIDEASQVLQPLTLAAISLAKKFILVGDLKQLPPIVHSNSKHSKELSVTLMELLTERYPESVVHLNTQFRMDPMILKLSNVLYYGNRIKYDNLFNHNAYPFYNLDKVNFNSHPEWIKKALSTESNNAIFIDINSNCKELESVEYYDDYLPISANGTKNLSNSMESYVISQLVHFMIENGLIEQKDLGIITPFNDQVKCIERSLLKYPHIEIHTVDRFQGRDKQCMLISFSRSITNGIGLLLKDSRRINVMLTRSRNKLILVGDSNVLEQSNDLKLLMDILKKDNALVTIDNYDNLPIIY